LDAVSEGLCRKASKDDGMDSADAGASEESSDSMPGHGEIDRNGVAFADIQRLEDVGEAANLGQKLAVGDEAALTRLIGLVYDGGLGVNEKWV